MPTYANKIGSNGFNLSKSPTVPPTARAHGTSHALAQKLQRSQVPLGFEISLGRITGSPKKNRIRCYRKRTGRQVIEKNVGFQVSIGTAQFGCWQRK